MNKSGLPKPLSPAKILSLDSRAIATGLLDTGTQEGYFQATEIISRDSIESSKEVLAVVGSHQFHLIEWRRCEKLGADHFHFRVQS